MPTIKLAILLLATSASARPVKTYAVSECKISHEDRKSEYAEIINELEIQTSSRAVPSIKEDCSSAAFDAYRTDALKIAEGEAALQGKIAHNHISPIRCATIPGRNGTDFVLVESAVSPIAEDIVNKSIFQIYAEKRTAKQRRELYGEYFDKKNVDNSAELKAVCGSDRLIVQKCHKLGCDFQVIDLNHTDGAVNVQFLRGGWGD